MQKKPMIAALAVAAVTAAILSTAGIAQEATPPAVAPAETTAQTEPGDCMMPDGMMGKGMMGGMMGMGPMGGPMGGFDFAAVDTDKDGKITEAEFTAFRVAKVTALDANADGKLSADELAAARIDDMTAQIKAMTTQMVAHSDVDGDGLLSAAELAARPMPALMFDRVDANSDGAVTQAELDSARPGMRGDAAQGQGGWFGRMMGHGRGDGHGRGEGHGQGRQGMMGQGGMGQGGMGQGGMGEMGQGMMGQGMMGQGGMGDCGNN